MTSPRRTSSRSAWLKRLGLTLVAIGLGLWPPHPASGAEILVGAAASLRDALTEISARFQAQSGIKVVLNFAASGTLARQIEEGAPMDIFFSADELKMDGLAKKGQVVAETRRSRLSNSLVLVAAVDGAMIHSPHDLTNAWVHRIALGDPKIVPAGEYAKAWLEKAGLWSGVERKIVPCENVRAVLAAVESGNVDAGVVYKTDGRISKKVKVVFEAPPGAGPTISYPVALLTHAHSPDAARRFLDYLAGGEVDAIFSRYGFIVPSAAGR